MEVFRGYSESCRKGFPTNRFIQALRSEKGAEAPLSLGLQYYTVLRPTTSLAFWSMVVSMPLSILSISKFVYQNLELGLLEELINARAPAAQNTTETPISLGASTVATRHGAGVSEDGVVLAPISVAQASPLLPHWSHATTAGVPALTPATCNKHGMEHPSGVAWPQGAGRPPGIIQSSPPRSVEAGAKVQQAKANEERSYDTVQSSGSNPVPPVVGKAKAAVPARPPGIEQPASSASVPLRGIAPAPPQSGYSVRPAAKASGVRPATKASGSASSKSQHAKLPPILVQHKRSTHRE